MPPEVSSTRVRIGRRRFVTSASPIAGMIRPIATRLCSIDMNSLRSAALNAQVSTTCCPLVLATRAEPIFRKLRPIVMAGLDPAIHEKKPVDPRVEPGDDGADVLKDTCFDL